MKTLHFTRRVEVDGSVRLDDLPSQAEVEIVVLYADPAEHRAELERWFAALRETREQVWEEHYAHQP